MLDQCLGLVLTQTHTHTDTVGGISVLSQAQIHPYIFHIWKSTSIAFTHTKAWGALFPRPMKISSFEIKFLFESSVECRRNIRSNPFLALCF